jgi:hypothetical protein
MRDGGDASAAAPSSTREALPSLLAVSAIDSIKPENHGTFLSTIAEGLDRLVSTLINAHFSCREGMVRPQRPRNVFFCPDECLRLGGSVDPDPHLASTCVPQLNWSCDH